MGEESRSLSHSVEDYLKVIYSLCESGDAASTSAVAEELEIQPASVTGMVKRLAEAGLLEHVPYRGVLLTDAGTREALRVIRRHRILETYLMERLDYSWEEVHREAERLEHAASDGLIERMAGALEHPSHDPHGAPIPTAGGEIEATDTFTLAELAPTEEAQVRAVRDQDSEDLRAAEEVGLLPGARVRVVARKRVPPTVYAEVADFTGKPLEIPMELARRIFVTPVQDPSPDDAGGAGPAQAGDGTVGKG